MTSLGVDVTELRGPRKRTSRRRPQSSAARVRVQRVAMELERRDTRGTWPPRWRARRCSGGAIGAAPAVRAGPSEPRPPGMSAKAAPTLRIARAATTCANRSLLSEVVVEGAVRHAGGRHDVVDAVQCSRGPRTCPPGRRAAPQRPPTGGVQRGARRRAGGARRMMGPNSRASGRRPAVWSGARSRRRGRTACGARRRKRVVDTSTSDRCRGRGARGWLRPRAPGAGSSRRAINGSSWRARHAAASQLRPDTCDVPFGHARRAARHRLVGLGCGVERPEDRAIALVGVGVARDPRPDRRPARDVGVSVPSASVDALSCRAPARPGGGTPSSLPAKYW